MNILLTGASGFIGSYLIPLILNEGHTLLGVDLVPAHEDPVSSAYTHLQGDLLDDKFIEKLRAELPGDLDGVIHLAGRIYEPAATSNPEETFAVNVDATGKLLTLLGEIGYQGVRFLVTSSCAVYGKLADGNDSMAVAESTPLNPQSVYAKSKAAQEHLVMAAHAAGGVSALVTRTFNLIGPGEDARFVSSAFMKQALAIKRGQIEPVIEVGNLDSVRDYTDVRDAVEGYWRVFKDGANGGVYNICSGKAVKTRWLLKMILNTVGVHPEVRTDPERMRPSDIPAMVGDNSLAHDELQWDPQIKLEQSLKDLQKSFE